ncbi:hypothetical protein AB0M43_35620 [Longispora sp. NPDC051575]|uniref:hypothetical protein n=1 Tax=Longispora sp. NPDC051575 TaxID=3154943 RepID=UPI003449F079
MNRTEEDLLLALRADEPGYVAPAPVLAAVGRLIVRRRRRRITVAATLGVLAVLAALLVPALSHKPPAPPATPPTTPATPTSRPALAITVREGDVNGTRFNVKFLSKNLQAFNVSSTAPAFQGTLMVYVQGRPLHEKYMPVDGAPTVTVAGRPAHYAVRDVPPTGPATHRALVWEWAPGGWAILEQSEGVPQIGLPPVLAERVEFGPPVVTRVPLRIAHLPAGHELAGVQWGYFNVSFRTLPTGSEPATTVYMYVLPTRDVDSLTAEHQNLTVAGHPSKWVPTNLSQYVDMGQCTLQFRTLTAPNPPYLEELVRGITMAPDCVSEATWFPATSSIAGGN